MGDVLRLVDYTNRDTVALARAILAASASGSVAGLEVRWITKDGREGEAASGSLRRRSALQEGKESKQL